MNIYSTKIQKYDIIFVQEIRDDTGQAFNSLCSMLSDYYCLNSSRAGSSTSKEQYGVLYKKDIEVTQFLDYNLVKENQKYFNRPPIAVTFSINGDLIKVYNIHTDPDSVPLELNNLQSIVNDSGSVMIIGDLNADCSYYDNSNETQFDSWTWVIPDNQDTTTKSTDCAYDRIILNEDAAKEYVSYGIDKDNITEEVSDHYLVWAEMKV